MGEFGVAEMHLKKGDSIIIYDPVSNKLKVIKEIYRTHLIKSNKRKPNKKSLNEPEDK